LPKKVAERGKWLSANPQFEQILKEAPTGRQKYYDRFAQFLKKTAGSQDALATAWGGSLCKDESIEAFNTSPFPAWFNPAAEPPSRLATA